jgi:hypothetical protein
MISSSRQGLAICCPFLQQASSREVSFGLCRPSSAALEAILLLAS